MLASAIFYVAGNMMSAGVGRLVGTDTKLVRSVPFVASAGFSCQPLCMVTRGCRCPLVEWCGTALCIDWS